MMYLKVLLGFVFLLGAADILVRGAVSLANRISIPPLVIGMTIVAFGTSAPELLVSLDAALAGSAAMALGNVIGSNMANMLLIVGAAALLKPIFVKPNALLRDSMVLLVSSLLFAWFCSTGVIGAVEGAVLLFVLAVFLGRSYWRHSHGGDTMAAAQLEEVQEFAGLKSMWMIWMALLAGLAGVMFGADLLVEGGVEIARTRGIAEEVIGLTVLAIGTSLPELAASVVAAFRGHTDVALGNVVGSNLFNILAVIGSVALVTPLAVPRQVLEFDLWLMLGVTVLMLPFLLGGWRLGRGAATMFLGGYVVYIAAQAYGVPSLLAMVK